jgi:hypothetical protein
MVFTPSYGHTKAVASWGNSLPLFTSLFISFLNQALGLIFYGVACYGLLAIVTICHITATFLQSNLLSIVIKFSWSIFDG